jgi:formylglycine-generating enzyme required for sulfatase activity
MIYVRYTIRGGVWNLNCYYTQQISVMSDPPDAADSTLGFRLIKKKRSKK